ncbi:hypothetical protein BGS_0103 [Beggiatoa sp. SS]|nr:hypothetical protein BGS_0103 [Beggiatoa sp. SS]
MVCDTIVVVKSLGAAGGGCEGGGGYPAKALVVPFCLYLVVLYENYLYFVDLGLPDRHLLPHRHYYYSLYYPFHCNYQ